MGALLTFAPKKRGWRSARLQVRGHRRLVKLVLARHWVAFYGVAAFLLGRHC